MKKYFDKDGNEIFVFEKGEKRDKAMFPRPHPAPGPRGRFPWWSIYTPVVPCIYDGALTLLEQISKLYYFANKLNDAINQNHNDIISLGELFDDLDVAVAEILELVDDLPKFVKVKFDTLNDPITADHSFADILDAYNDGAFILGETNSDKNLYIVFSASQSSILFLAPVRSGSVSLIMTANGITQEITTNATVEWVSVILENYLALTGGTMTGAISQPLAPTEDNHLTNKKYVDDQIGNIDLSGYLALTGGTMEGQITQPLAPTENRHLANKRYIDNSISNATRYIVGGETKIGEWVENNVVYDVYRKIVDFGELPNASQKTVPHGIANITRFISARAFASSTTNSLEIPMSSADGTNNIYLGVGNRGITIGTASDRSNFTMCYVELKFIILQPVPIDGE